MALLSATRGWIISFSLVIMLSVLLTGMIRSKRNISIVLISIPVIIWALANPTISKQVDYARERLETMGAISEGDLTARGTLQRLDFRSQKVMDGWRRVPCSGGDCQTKDMNILMIMLEIKVYWLCMV